ncbi:MAG: DegT/DnrJ/EryC1/StrS family aminotransferase [Candidatus Sungbacteria bacterium]|nr:DegT/DnrJ/EryC1/StrS family aminotransferase [Candidatus Sungbacteria bacterium]
MFEKRKRQLGVGGAVITPLHKRYVMQVLRSGRLSYGPFLKAFEAKFAELHNRRFAISANSGTSALQVALHALKELDGWRDGDEVLVPAMTFIATSNVVIQNRLKPVFVDIDPRTYHIDPKDIEKRITPRTRAIMPVHLFGVSADMQAIKQIAKRHKLRIIEDACQTAAVSHRGEPVGSEGDIACFSTYIAHIVTTGVGGMALTNDQGIALKMRSLVNHGRDNIYISADDDKGLTGKKLTEVMSRRFNFVSVGYSYRLTELEGALGLAEIKNISGNIAVRQKNAKLLLALLKPYEKYLQLPWWPEHSGHAFMMFPIVVTTKRFTRDELARWLEERNVETRPFYSLLGQPVYRRLFGEYAAKRYPIADWTQKNGLFVGCHVELKSKDIKYIGNVFKEFFKGKKLQ